MNKLWAAIAITALVLSLCSLLSPQQVIVERTITIEREAQAVDETSPTQPSLPTYIQPTRYRWMESASYYQWKNSFKTEDKYLPSHFGLDGWNLSGYWERR